LAFLANSQNISVAKAIFYLYKNSFERAAKIIVVFDENFLIVAVAVSLGISAINAPQACTACKN